MMKTKNWMRTAIFAVLAMAAAACTDNDLIDKDVNNTPDIKGRKMTIYAATGGEAADTRVAFKDGSQTAISSLKWQKEDYLAVVLMKDGKVEAMETDFLYDGVVGERSGSFTGTAIDMVEGGEWYIYYPNTAVNPNGTVTLSMTGQTQTKKDNTEHLKNYILLEATGIKDLANGCDLKMKNSIMKFELREVPSDIGELKNLVWMVETDNGTQSMTLGFTPGAVKSDGSNLSLYAFLSFMPQDMKPKTDGKFTVILTGDKTYVAEGKVNKSFVEGMRYTAELGEGIMEWKEKAIMALTVKVGANKEFNIPFPESGKVPAKLTVDWGDGEAIEVASGTDLKPDDNFNHTYSAAGTYTITITSDQTNETQQQIPDFNFRNNRSYYGINGTKLISIDTPLLNTTATNFSDCFSGCSALQSIPSGLFDKNTEATNFSDCFSGCSELQSIPSGLFDKNTAATNFSTCFSYCYALQSIPSGLFDKNIHVTSFQDCFSDCSELQSIPSGLFGNNTNATNFSRCFSDCSELQSIPSGLFDKNTNATDFSDCFSNCSALQSIPSGLFDNNTNATDFSFCFSDCSALQSIPSGLFDNNTKATDFSSCFSRCSKLQSIPSKLFDNNTAATDFSYCFSNCSELQSIPSGLFDNNTAASDFFNCFRDCHALKEIPSGLFNNNTQVTSFQVCFRGCSALEKIPSGLFINNTQVTSFEGCFQGCTALKEIPQGLFDNNTVVSDFVSCFRDCSALQSIPPGLFDNNKQVENFNFCFSGCTHLALNPKIFSTTEDKSRFSKQKMYFGSCFQNVGSALESGKGGTAPELWKYDGAENWIGTSSCFTGATKLVNYPSIPDNWKGL